MSKNPEQITKETYDKIAFEYVKRKERSKIWALANSYVVRNFLKRLPKSSSGDILVVGPAGGHTSIMIAKKTGRFVKGIDFSKGMAAEAEKLKSRSGIKNCSFEVGDIVDVKLTGKFDGILCDGVLYHIDRKKLPALLRKLRNHLSSDGVLYANFKTGDGFELQQDPVTFPGSPRAYWFYNEEELEGLLQGAGFKAEIKPNKIPLFGEYFIEVTARKA